MNFTNEDITRWFDSYRDRQYLNERINARAKANQSHAGLDLAIYQLYLEDVIDDLESRLFSLELDRPREES